MRFNYSILKTIILLLIIVCSRKVKAQDVLVVDSTICSNSNGLEKILQDNISGLRIKSWTGTSGSQSIINLRGLSIDPTDESTMPLIMVNGVPIIASPSEVTAINPLSSFTPDQVERIEIIKDIDKLSEYGVQAPNGAINIVTKEGSDGPLHVRVSAFMGNNFVGDFDEKKDAFYNFTSIARKKVYKGSIIHEQNALIDGGGSYGSYLFGINNHYDSGILDDTKFNRQSLFFNAKYNITDKFDAKFYNNLTISNREGRYAGEYDRSFSSPVVEDETYFRDKKRNTSLISSINLTYGINDKFNVNSVSGISYEGARRDLYIPANIYDGYKYALSTAYKRQLITVNTTLKYANHLSDDLRFNMVIGNEIRNQDNRITYVQGQRSLEDGGSDYVQVVTGYSASQTNAYSDHELINMASFYGIWNLIYKNDLKCHVVLRTDGSSVYNNKWALYPAVGLDYNLKKVANIPLQINAGIGKTGVLASSNVYQGELISFGEYYSDDIGVGVSYPTFDDAKSTDVIQMDAGVKYNISSFTISARYFNKQYSDFTYERYLSNISGLDYKYETGLGLGLHGAEFSLNGKFISHDNFLWLFDFNIASQKNTITDLPDDITNTNLSEFESLKKGDEITSFIAYEGDEQKIIGDSEADFFGGFSNTLKYKNISLGFTFSFVEGADIVAESFDSRYSEDEVEGGFPVKSSETPYYFKEEDEDGNTVYQGIKAVENGSFIRLSRADVSYDLSSLFNTSTSITDMLVFTRAENVFTFSKYGGVNPEENINGIREYDLSTTGTPLPVSVVFGLKLKF